MQLVVQRVQVPVECGPSSSLPPPTHEKNSGAHLVASPRQCSRGLSSSPVLSQKAHVALRPVPAGGLLYRMPTKPDTGYSTPYFERHHAQSPSTMRNQNSAPSKACPDFQTQIAEESRILKQFHCEFEAYKREQEAVIQNLHVTVIQNLRSEVEERLTRLETCVSTMAHLLVSLGPKQHVDAKLHRTQFWDQASKDILNDGHDAAVSRDEIHAERPHISGQNLKSEAPELQKLRPRGEDEPCSDGERSLKQGSQPAGKIIWSPRVPNNDAPSVGHTSLEKLSNILSEVASSWLQGGHSKVQFDPSLQHRMEHVCDELQHAIQELHKPSSNGSSRRSFGSSRTSRHSKSENRDATSVVARNENLPYGMQDQD